MWIAGFHTISILPLEGGMPWAARVLVFRAPLICLEARGWGKMFEVVSWQVPIH